MLYVTNPRKALFYYLPEIHKHPTKPPGRRVITGVDSLTSNLSQYIDHNLQKYVIKLDSYLKDTDSVINEVINIKWCPGYRWATLDVATLYSNFPHDKGLSAVHRYLASDDFMPERQKIFILEGLKFILQHNVFTFNGQLYIQTNGTNVGTQSVPILYMGEFVKNYIKSHHPWRNNIIRFKQYIDDLLFIWDGPENDFHSFTEYLNENNWGLKFSGEINSTLNY